ncbi:UNVERIFIED_CONTAM: AT-hook motif nuclear-localized protein 1 [Sesamum radiatum]|uniref:AT-hook motif nuclear-localized protein n=1 Tax=Sesamum radiatum TaxID=300843 RepID=A0AAW2R514_SESRA
MELEDKESTESGSPAGNSEVDSPPSSGGAYGGQDSGAAAGGVVPGSINMAVNISMEKNAGVTSPPAVQVGAGVTGGSGVMGGGILGGGSGELLMGKKKRGRPRKYDADGNLRAGYMGSPPGAATQAGFTLSTPPSHEYSSGPKKGRGKHSGSGNWKALASLGELFAKTAGGDFTPHVVTVYTGEDVAGKILTFAQKGSRGVCVLSANGSVSNVTIRQPGSSGGLLTYEA